MIWLDIAALALAAVGVAVAVRANVRSGRAEDCANKIAAQQLDLEHGDRHDARGPVLPAAISTELRESRQGHYFLVGEITVQRDYRVRGEAVSGSARWPLALDLVLQAGRSYSIEVEKWPSGKKRPQARELELKFWPPLEGDGVVAWSCRCGRPAFQGDGSGPGHWEVSMEVEYYDVADSVF